MRPGILNSVGSAVLPLLLGGTTGVVTTFAHRAYPIDVGIRLPLGLVAGFAILAALLAGFRLVFESRIPAIAAAVGAIATIAVLALPGAGGSVLVVDDPVGYAWAIGPVTLALVVVGWPRRRPHSVEQSRPDERPLAGPGRDGEDR